MTKRDDLLAQARETGASERRLRTLAAQTDLLQTHLTDPWGER